MKGVRKPVKIPCRQIFAMESQVAQQYGLRAVQYKAVRFMYDAPLPLPIHTYSDNGELWVDKYYIAYRLGGGSVRYIYLARAHIREEMSGYKRASKARNRTIMPPPDVFAAFCRAYRAMKAEDKNIWIFPEYAVANSK